jgi:hypothetical protein
MASQSPQPLESYGGHGPLVTSASIRVPFLSLKLSTAPGQRIVTSCARIQLPQVWHLVRRLRVIVHPLRTSCPSLVPRRRYGHAVHKTRMLGGLPASRRGVYGQSAVQ